MASPDYLEQVVVSGRRWATTEEAQSERVSIFHRPSLTSLSWATLDLVTVVVSTLIALSLRVSVPSSIHNIWKIPYLIYSAPPVLLIYVAWFSLLLVVIARSYGLYDPIMNRSGLHEQRLTVQVTCISGLLLCGTLYLARAEAISRIVIVLMVVITPYSFVSAAPSGARWSTDAIAVEWSRATS